VSLCPRGCGPHATAAAATEGARAFAAGAHLVFAEGAYRPQTAEGLRLIAHETAHAVQQMPFAQGGGARVMVQRDPADPADPAATPKPAANFWPDLKAIYAVAETLSGRTLKPSDPVYAADIAGIEAIIGTGGLFMGVRDATAKALIAAYATAPPKSFRAKCLVHDIFKLVGDHDSALAFLMAHPTIETIGNPKDYTDHVYSKADGPAVVKLFLETKASDDITSDWTAVLAWFEKVVSDPALALPPKSPLATRLETNLIDRQARVASGGRMFWRNPLQHLMLSYLVQLEQDVIDFVADPASTKATLSSVGLPDDPTLDDVPLIRHAQQVHAVHRLLTDTTEHPTLQALKAHLTSGIGDTVERYHARLMLSFEAATGLANSTRQRYALIFGAFSYPMGTHAAIEAFLRPIASAAKPDVESSPFHLREPDEGTKALMAGGPMARTVAFFSRLPDGFTQAAAHKALFDALQAGRADLLKRLSQTRPRPNAGRSGFNEGEALLALLIWLDWFLAWGKPLLEVKAGDARATTRYDFALALRNLGAAFSQIDLFNATVAATEAADLGISYAVMPGPFVLAEKQDFTDMSRLSGDVRVVAEGDSADAHVGSLGVTFDDVVALYQLFVLRGTVELLENANASLKIEVEQRLKETQREEHAREKAAEAAGKPLMPKNLGNLSEKARAAMPLPQLYEVKDGHIVKHPDDPSTAAKIQFQHPLTQELVDAMSADPQRKGGFFARDNTAKERVYFWHLPPLGPIYRELREMEGLFDLMVAFEASDLGQGVTIDLHRLFLFQKWLVREGKLGVARKHLTAGLEEHHQIEMRMLRAAQRTFTSLNRGIALDNIIDLLVVRSSSIERIGLAGDFGLIIGRFAMGVEPREEREMQVTILMLEAADHIRGLVEKRPDYEAVNFLLPHVSLALQTVSGKPLEQLRPDDLNIADDRTVTPEFLLESEVFAPRYASAATQIGVLKAVLKALLKARLESQKMFRLYASRKSGLHSELAGYNIKAGSDDASFIMALWSPKDVTDPKEGNWTWAEDVTATDTAQVALPGVEAEPPEAKKIYGGIVGTESPIYYRITQLYSDFEYIPTYNAQAEQARSRGMALVPGTKTEIPATKPLVEMVVVSIIGSGEDFRFGDERKVVIRAGDRQLLDLLAAIIDSHSRATQLTRMAEGMEAGAEFLLDLAEFIPGVGQVIMASRLIASAIQLMQELDWDEIRAELVEAPIEILKALDTDFMAKLDGDLLWWFLLSPLLGDSRVTGLIQVIEGARAKSKEKRQKQEIDRRSGGLKGKGNVKTKRYRALGAAIANIGQTFGDAMLKVRAQADRGITSAMGKLMTVPSVGMHLSRIDQYLTWIETAQIMAQEAALAAGLPDDLAEIRLDFDKETFGAAMGDLFSPITTIELPAEVIPMDIAIEIILEMALSRVKNKKFRVVYELLRISGGLSKLAQMVKVELLDNSPLDPNKYWRENIVTKFEEPFRKGRDDLVDQIYEVMEEVFGTIPRPTLTVPTVERTETELPEVEGFNLPSDPRHPMPAVLPHGDGSGLPKPLRQALEDDFGHHLDHVRLHDDDAAWRFVDITGAEALASGSHIYLGGGIDPGSDHGRHVLRHEVAHVLQQTGARPFGAPISHRCAVPGAAGRGVVDDPQREAAAERMARAAGRRDADADDPVRVIGTGARRLSPFGRHDILRVLRTLGRPDQNLTFARRIELGTDQLSQHGHAAKAEADRLLREISAKLGSAHWTRDKPAIQVPKKLEEMVRTAAAAAVTRATQGNLSDKVATRASILLPKRLQKPHEKYKLDPRSFVNMMAGLLYDMSGIRMDIDVSTLGTSEVTKVDIVGLHLGRIYAVGTPVLYREIKAHNGNTTSPPFDFRQARGYYAEIFPLRHDWALDGSGNLILPAAERDRVMGRVKARKDMRDAQSGMTMLAPGDLPEWKDYTDPVSAGVGVKVGSHGLLSKHAGKAEAFPDTTNPVQDGKPDTRAINNAGRESHHLPQFLLSEFYAGKNESTSAWGNSGDTWMPGFTKGGTAETARPGSKQEYDGFKGGGQQIDFNALDIGKNRGNAMPAVSLARGTHREGGLHLGMEKNWANLGNDTGSPTTQAYLMLNRHRTHVIEAVNAIRPELALAPDAPTGVLSDPKVFMAVVDHAIKNGKADALAAANLAAMRASYSHVVKVMLNALDPAFDTLERPYYAGLANARLSGSNSATSDDIPKASPYYPKDNGWKKTVIGALKKKNQQVYKAWFVAESWS